MGMAIQLGKFTCNLAELSQPLRELLNKKSTWVWGVSQERAFSAMKAELARPTTLALYDPAAETKVSADASSYGLGAVLLQKFETTWKPFAFSSRSTTETERHYAQIEKEGLATAWACEKFADYIPGKRICIETDHKPLVLLLGTKFLDRLPPRVLRFRLRLAHFDYSMEYVPGKYLYTADTLSRAPTAPAGMEDVARQEKVEHFMGTVTASLPASKKRLDTYCESQAKDPICSQVMMFCREGWPPRKYMAPELQPYSVQESSTVQQQDHCSGLPPTGNAPENPSWSPGHPEVQSHSEDVSLVAWSPKAD